MAATVCARRDRQGSRGARPLSHSPDATARDPELPMEVSHLLVARLVYNGGTTAAKQVSASSLVAGSGHRLTAQAASNPMVTVRLPSRRFPPPPPPPPPLFPHPPLFHDRSKPEHLIEPQLSREQVLHPPPLYFMGMPLFVARAGTWCRVFAPAGERGQEKKPQHHAASRHVTSRAEADIATDAPAEPWHSPAALGTTCDVRSNFKIDLLYLLLLLLLP
ncbi:uncharacterized protein PSFLO_06739 [Pseudozyma flocculosa]|uniref:Uncharacterized protein n=1 Tax=Pseudozyma flocculosa TaxID=84751 RepID=A0A5C3FCA4_9BASI|nr:uncharacterized protein PSFLO_06739 [Pseudozyma flocculosa]